MKTSVDLGPPGHVLRISIDDEVLQRGVAVHQLTLRVGVHASWLDAVDTQASAAVVLEGAVHSGDPARPLALLPTRVLNVRSFPINERLPLLLSDDQLLQLEVDRAGGGVDLQLDLAVTFLDAVSLPYPTYDAQVVHRITAGRWQELLEGTGRIVGITVRVTMPLAEPASRPVLGDADPSLTRAGARLREARTALRDGDVLTSVQLCRHVLDNLRLLNPPQPAEAVRKAAPQSRSESQRWSALFHDLYSLASAASHDDEITSAFSWSRADAQAILAATAGLLARVANADA